MGEPFSAVGSVACRLSLASKRCVYNTRSKLKLCYAVYLHRKDVGLLPVLTSMAMNTRHSNPIVLQRTCFLQITRGTKIQLCRKEPAIGKITHLQIMSVR